MELRQYYLERNKEVRARSRRKVLHGFSPYLAEEVVWELDKKWLVKVPCFSLAAERITGGRHTHTAPSLGIARVIEGWPGQGIADERWAISEAGRGQGRHGL